MVALRGRRTLVWFVSTWCSSPRASPEPPTASPAGALDFLRKSTRTYGPQSYLDIYYLRPVLIHAGYPELEPPVPWWQGRRLRFGFPPRQLDIIP